MISLYIHIPFCKRKCFYCSFVVSIGHEDKTNLYLDCLEKEAALYRGVKIKSLYVGGGTPSVLLDEHIDRLFLLIEKNFSLIDGCEITFECNPDGMTREKLEQLKKRGVNRVSLGVQSFNDALLKYLGRSHGGSDAVKALELIHEVSFNVVSADLMFSFEGQTIENLNKDIELIGASNTNHVSLYSLSIEHPSRFFTKNILPVTSDFQIEQYVFIINKLKDYGFDQYEVSNFSQNGKQSIHNLNYWQLGEYVGLGVGAHSYVNASRYGNVCRLNDYINKIQQNGNAIEERHALKKSDQFKDAFLFGLRMNKGVDVSELSRRYGVGLSDEEKKAVIGFVEEGLLETEGVFLKTTDKGRLLLDEMAVRLI